MLAFTMPSEKEEDRRKRFEKALKAAGISVEEERFLLNIEEGEILSRVHDEIGFENLQHELSLGCVAKIPSIRCQRNENGNRMMYVRMMNANVAREGMYENRIPVMGKITEALSNPAKYSESFFVNRRGKNAIIQSENGGWCLKINGNEIIDSGQDGAYLEDAVGLMLDFYKSNNL